MPPSHQNTIRQPADSKMHPKNAFGAFLVSWGFGGEYFFYQFKSLILNTTSYYSHYL